jgi:sRNA-binding regulator protein Hfq
MTFGYALDYIFQLYFLDWLCILFFFILGIIFLINGEIQNEIYLFDEYKTLIKTNSNSDNINKLSLSIIPEAKNEESFSLNEKTYLLDKNEENNVNNLFFEFFIDLKEYIFSIYKNYIFIIMAFLCFIYESDAVIYASIIDFFFVIILTFIFKVQFLKFWNENVIDSLIGIFMIIISIQLYLSKTFGIRR